MAFLSDPRMSGMSEAEKQSVLRQLSEIRAETNAAFAKTGTTSGITTGTNLVSIPLEAPAKNLYSVWTRLRERLSRENNGKGGLSVTWRAITGIFGGGYDAAIAEASVGSSVSVSEVDNTAYYKTLGRLNSATFEAISASMTFDDVVALATLEGLQNLQVSEEISIIGGNTTQISAPASVSFADTATAGTGSLTPSTTYYYAVSAVTLLGTQFLNGGSAWNGTTGYSAGKSGSTNSPNETTAVTGSHATTGSGAGSDATIVSWPAVKGAVAYNVFVGTTATVHFLAQVSSNSYTLTSVAGVGTNVANTSNTTANSLQFDGIINQAANASNGTFVDVGGGTLTANNAGGVVQIDNALQSLFEGPKVAPSLAVVSGQQALDIRNKILASGGTLGAQRFNTDIGANGELRGGSIFMNYVNPFFPSMPMEVLAHPYMPPGTMLLITEKLPAWYPNANIGTTWSVDCRRDFYSVEYAISTSSGRQKPVGVYTEEVLKGYFPTGTAVITGVAAG